MADHRALGRLGWVFGAVTAGVLLMAAAVVTTYSTQPANAGASPSVAASTSTSATH